MELSLLIARTTEADEIEAMGAPAAPAATAAVLESEGFGGNPEPEPGPEAEREATGIIEMGIGMDMLLESGCRNGFPPSPSSSG